MSIPRMREQQVTLKSNLKHRRRVVSRSSSFSATGLLVPLVGAVSALVLVGAATAGYQALFQAPNTSWASGPALQAAVYQHAAVLLNDGRLLVIGGRGANDQPTAQVEFIQTQASAMTVAAAAAMTSPRSGLTATKLLDGRVLVTGGFLHTATGSAGAIEQASTEIYDPVANVWSRAAPMTVARALQTATLLHDGRVLVVGNPVNALGVAPPELYDPKSNSWSSTGLPVVTRLAGHTATLLTNGRVLVVGGTGGSRPGYLTSAEIYDPATNSWSSTAPTTVAHSQATAVALTSGNVLIVGGSGGVAAAELFDPAKSVWTSAGSLAYGRTLHTATLLGDGRVVVTGGYGRASLLSASEIYDPVGNAWSPGPSLPTGLATQTATLLPDGTVLLVGGVNSEGTPTAASEVLQ